MLSSTPSPTQTIRIKFVYHLQKLSHGYSLHHMRYFVNMIAVKIKLCLQLSTDLQSLWSKPLLSIFSSNYWLWWNSNQFTPRIIMNRPKLFILCLSFMYLMRSISGASQRLHCNSLQEPLGFVFILQYIFEYALSLMYL